MSQYLLEKVTSFGYRPDIDGLRALAVLSVLFYHVEFTAFTGGYVGVDVFFVISGYLITRNIVSELQQDRFSCSKFYLRRARRLLPALLFTLILSFLIGAVILTPGDLANFARSLIFSIIPASNFYFWKEIGYFSPDAIVKPLLHIWSLSVEEQFYLIWPTLLSLLFTFYRSWIMIAIMLFVAAGSLFLTKVHFPSDPQGVFYLTHYRAAEFVAGALCVWLVNYRLNSKLANEVVLVTGLSMILYAVFTYNDKMIFPGVSTMLPVLGAMLVIYAGSPQFSSQILSNRLAVGIGLISYSLYLIHWPLLVFFTYIAAETWYLPYAVITISLAAATWMYFFVETPFRKPKPKALTYSARSFIALTLTLSFILILIAMSAAWKSNGWSWRLPPGFRELPTETKQEQTRRLSIYRQICEASELKICLNPNASTQAKNVVIMGDSHAIDILNVLYSINAKQNYVVSTAFGCPPLVKEDYMLLGNHHPNRGVCMQLNEERFHGELLSKTDLVVINVLFNWYKPEHLRKAITKIRQRTRAPIWVFGNYITLKVDLPTQIIKSQQTFTGIIPADWVGAGTFKYESQLQALSKEQDFIFLSKQALLCTGKEIKTCATLLDGGKWFTYDKHHLSMDAAVLLGEKLQAQYPDLIKSLN